MREQMPWTAIPANLKFFIVVKCSGDWVFILLQINNTSWSPWLDLHFFLSRLLTKFQINFKTNLITQKPLQAYIQLDNVISCVKNVFNWKNQGSTRIKLSKGNRNGSRQGITEPHCCSLQNLIRLHPMKLQCGGTWNKHSKINVSVWAGSYEKKWFFDPSTFPGWLPNPILHHTTSNGVGSIRRPARGIFFVIAYLAFAQIVVHDSCYHFMLNWCIVSVNVESNLGHSIVEVKDEYLLTTIEINECNICHPPSRELTEEHKRLPLSGLATNLWNRLDWGIINYLRLMSTLHGWADHAYRLLEVLVLEHNPVCSMGWHKSWKTVEPWVGRLREWWN